MKSRLMLVLVCWISLISSGLTAQTEDGSQRYEQGYNQRIRDKIKGDFLLLRPYFEEAYQRYETIPRGMLEAVSFQYTRFASRSSADYPPDEAEIIPRTYSVMGLTPDGKGVFRDNLVRVARLSGMSPEEIQYSDRAAILAYAAAFAELQRSYQCYGNRVEQYSPILIELCELPLSENAIHYRYDDFAINSFLYEVFLFLSDTSRAYLDIPVYRVDLEGLFAGNLTLLQQSSVFMEVDDVVKGTMQTDYPDAVWQAAASCNYTQGRGGVLVSNVTIHYTSGTYAGSIAWFKNCQAKASAHYVIRSLDGQITQMVREADKAWHVGSANGYTIGIEHEAYGNIWSFFTPQMYQSSAALVRDICNRHPAINPHRMFYRDTLDNGTLLNTGLHSLGGSTACVQIRGHQHYPSQTHTDPGPYWDWNYYYKLINPVTGMQVFADSAGSFFDSGGPNAPYNNDERQLYFINPTGADSIILDFTSFDLEADYDFLWIYAGSSVFAPKVGRWNTLSPGRVVVPGDAAVVEFRSDCATTAAGWEVHWHACFPAAQTTDTTPPNTWIVLPDDTWQTKDFNVSYLDSDDVALQYCFYQVMENRDGTWTANPHCGFLYDNFDNNLDTMVWPAVVNCQVENQHLKLDGIQSGNAMATARLNGLAHDVILYDFYWTWNNGSDGSFFFHCDAPPLPNSVFSGYRIRFLRGNQSIRITKVENGVECLLGTVNDVNLLLQQPYRFRIVWNRSSEVILLFQQSTLLGNFSAASSPQDHGSADYVAFAAEGSSLEVDDVRVYGSRGALTRITVGAADTCMMRYPSWNSQVAAKVRSIVLDSAHNFSSLEEKRVKVDFSPPTIPNRLKVNTRMMSLDVQDVTVLWPDGYDPHSDVKHYEYKLILSNSNNNANRGVWRNLGLATSVPLSLDCRQIREMQIQVRAENWAGLKSAVVQQRLSCQCDNHNTISKQFAVSPNPIRDVLVVEDMGNEVMTSSSAEARIVRLYDLAGRMLQESTLSRCSKLSLKSYPPGIYVLRILQGGKTVWSEKVVKMRD